MTTVVIEGDQADVTVEGGEITIATHDQHLTSNGVTSITVLTQAEYAALSPPDPLVLYVLIN